MLAVPVPFVRSSQLAYSKKCVSFPSVLNLTDFGAGLDRPVLGSSPSIEVRPKRGVFGTEGFFKAGRNMTKDEFDEEGVEQEEEESSVVAVDDAEGVFIVNVGTVFAFAEDRIMVSLSEGEDTSISRRRGMAG